MDLRGCVYTGKKLADKVLSGALVSDADLIKRDGDEQCDHDQVICKRSSFQW